MCIRDSITSPGRACHEPLEHKSVHERTVLKLALDDGTSDGVWLGTEGPGVRASCVHAHAAPMRAEPDSLRSEQAERLGTRRRVDAPDAALAQCACVPSSAAESLECYGVSGAGKAWPLK